MIKVLLLHNIIAPYRLPLFQELAKKLDLEVKFCKSGRKDRLWKPSLVNYSFKYEVLKSISIGPFVINYTLPFKLLLNRYQVYIVALTLRDIFSVLTVLFTAKLLGRPFVVWSGFIESSYAKYIIDPKYKDNKLGRIMDIFFGMLIRFICRNSDCFIAYGNKAKEFLIRHGAPQDKIFIGTQVISGDTTTRVTCSKSETEFKDKKIILYLGYFNKRKGINYLINAFKRIQHEDAILILAGAGEEEENLKLLAKGEENIYFTGYVEGKDKHKYYSIADIFVLPSLHDPWAFVINEAMHFGLPIITTKEVGSSELINGNGFVVKAGDEEELKSAIEELLSDDELRRKMGAKSKEIIKKYNLNYAVNAFLNAVNYAMGEGKTKRVTRK